MSLGLVVLIGELWLGATCIVLMEAALLLLRLELMGASMADMNRLIVAIVNLWM